MKITKTVKLKITSHTRIFENTLAIYQKALSFYIGVCDKEWLNIKDKSGKDQLNLLEKLSHKTSKNKEPEYNFTDTFYKYPSYFRRSTIMDAIGSVSSYKSNYQNWLEEKEKADLKGKKFFKKPPTLQTDRNSFPVFYKSNMFKRNSDNQAEIKIFKNNDWNWLTINFQSKNFGFGNGEDKRGLLEYKEQNPKLVKKGKKYFLHIPFEKNIKLADNKKDHTIVAVDLGLTNSAVCSALNSDGTVIGRKFINQPIEKDQLKKELHKLAKASRNSGKCEKPNIWRRINNLQKYITQHTTEEIFTFAKEHNASVIVFEDLSRFKVPKGFYGVKRLRAKLQFWAKRAIQKKTEQKAHVNGLRISFVIARNTSKLAFDGSGEVKRSGKRDLCQFQSGKTYHADLSASYNIGARYFIRFLLKTLPEKARSMLEAKAPEVLDRINQTLASLIRLHEVTQC